MLHPAWIAREAPLARCPLLHCRRSRTCRHSTDADPCRRLHESKEAARLALAIKLERMTAEARRRDPEGRNVAAEGTLEFERRLTFLHDALRARDIAESARARRAGTAPAKEKPASTGTEGA